MHIFFPKLNISKRLINSNNNQYMINFTDKSHGRKNITMLTENCDIFVVK